VEIDEDQIKIVYRISPVPFEQRPQGGFSQDCLRRAFPGNRSRIAPGKGSRATQETGRLLKGV
jgi:hypothetical protein